MTPAFPSPPLRIGVVGAGVFGTYHVAKAAGHGRATLSGVFDIDAARASRLARAHGARGFASLDALLAESDAVVVASSATAHAPAALAAIEAGLPVLVEKPLAHTLEAAERIVERAATRGTVLQVGHQERFVASAIGLDHIDEPPLSIRCWRETPWSGRGADVSVALDLMIHDIDLVLWLVGAEPERVDGEAQVLRSAHPDRVEATLGFSATTAWLSASRVADAPRRDMELTYPSGSITVDFLAKTLTNTSEHPVVANWGDDPRARDSLGAATDAFVSAVLDGTPVPITGGMGLRALRYALRASGEGASEEGTRGTA